MDGTFAGDGPGPRAMRIHTKNIILASADQVAIDAVAARLMGFDPMTIPKIRIAHEMGLAHRQPQPKSTSKATTSQTSNGTSPPTKTPSPPAARK